MEGMVRLCGGKSKGGMREGDGVRRRERVGNDCTQRAKGSWEPRRAMCLHTLTALIHTHTALIHTPLTSHLNSPAL